MTVMEEQQCSEFMLSTVSVTFEINLKDFLAETLIRFKYYSISVNYKLLQIYSLFKQIG